MLALTIAVTFVPVTSAEESANAAATEELDASFGRAKNVALNKKDQTTEWPAFIPKGDENRSAWDNARGWSEAYLAQVSKMGNQQRRRVAHSPSFATTHRRRRRGCKWCSHHN